MTSAPRFGLSHGDYSVGWICALPLELTAAMAMFDERHPVLLQDVHDDNVYHLGRIGQHNVVMTCLPAGRMGTNSAATVAGLMRSTFPAIRFWLLVGIGGGAPNPEHDIRLGDVVVSRPGKNDGGVIQYDFGRTVREGRFVRSGMLNAPPASLLNAVSAVEAKHRFHGHKLAEYLSAFASPLLRTKYTYQGWENDLLFEASYDHVGTESTCERCDKSRLLARPTRPTDPVIHYGTIASGNQVMRHGGSRERLRKESGVLCFEMEAAGLMNSFPCIVIRGICDYADSHKNKLWQEYAAATASAYAKELLSTVPQHMPSEVAVDRSSSNNSIKTQDPKTEYKPRLMYIPYHRNPRFSGRKSVLGLIDKHFDIYGSQKPFILRGMGGIGKTQIALEYAYRNHFNGFDVFWVNCSTPQNFHSDFDQIKRAAEPETKEEEEVERPAMLQSLEHHDNWLIVFDNADDATFPYADWIPQSKEGVPSCRILFTTRDERLAHAVIGANAEVPLMDDDEAVDLFKGGATDLHDQSTGRDLGIQTLVQRLGNLPLAIALASAYLHEYPWVTIGQYVELLDSFSERSKIFNYKQAFSNYNHSIMSTWEISFARVQADNPEAADILVLLGFLENDPANLEFLRRVSTETRNRHLGFLRNSAGLEQSLGLLRSLALLSFDGRRISLHPLVHEWISARLRMGDVVEWGLRALSAVYYACIPCDYPHDGILQVPAECDAHIRFALTAINGHSLPQFGIPVEAFLVLLTLLLLDQDGISIICSISRPVVTQQGPTASTKLQQESAVDRGADVKAYRKLRASAVRGLKVLGRRSRTFSRKDIVTPDPGSPRSSVTLPQPQFDVSATSFAADTYSGYPKSELVRGPLVMLTAMNERFNNDPEIAPYAKLCAQVALSIQDLREWWRRHTYHGSGNPVTPETVAESCQKLETLLSYCNEIPNQDDDIAKIPPPVLATLFSYITAAAMNMGHSIHTQLETPTRSFKVMLFQKAYALGKHLDTPSREQHLLNAAISYARFVDQRSMIGPSHWLPVEACLLDIIAGPVQNPISSYHPALLEFFCQSLWESDHEYALLKFCRRIEQTDPRISEKWAMRLQARWAELKMTEPTYTGFSKTERALLARLKLD